MCSFSCDKIINEVDNMTINEIARIAGVSRGTVDRVIHNRGKVKPEIQQRIEEIIRETGFSPNLAASALKRSANGLQLGAILPPLTNSFYVDVLKGFQSAAEHYAQYGVTLSIVQLTELTLDEQYCTAWSLLDQGLDGLILSALNTPFMTDYINHLADEIPVVTYNTDFTNSSRLCFVGQDHIQAGRTAGNLLCNSLRRPGSILPLISYENILAHTRRVDGLRAVLPRCPVDVRLLPAVETAESDEVAYDVVTNWLHKQTDLTCIYVAGGGQIGAADALADSGRANEIMMFCHDLLPKTIEHLKSGVVDYTIGQQPFLQGYLPVAILYEYLALGQKPAKEFYYTSIDIRLRENADVNGISAIAGAL